MQVSEDLNLLLLPAAVTGHKDLLVFAYGNISAHLSKNLTLVTCKKLNKICTHQVPIKYEFLGQ